MAASTFRLAGRVQLAGGGACGLAARAWRAAVLATTQPVAVGGVVVAIR